ncbi:wax ester/triacylglycerol synthase domain-containing protein [Tessaracoccus sp. G1721]
MVRDRERLSPADASNVVMDSPDQVNAFLLAGLLDVGGFVSPDGAVDLELLRASIASRLSDPELARFSQRVHQRTLTWGPCRPDLSRHIRLAAPVAGMAGLADMAARLMTTPLPLEHPLWELLVVPGAATPAPGIILRVHHCVADGVAGVRLVQRLFGADAVATSAPSVGSGRRRRRVVRGFVAGLARVAAVFRATVPPTVLLGPIGPRRGVAFADVELRALAGSARRAGATVNDALLAAVVVAAEAALRADGHRVPPVLPASVPVALPERGLSGNAVGVMLVPLVTGEADPVARLSRIAQVTRAGKAEARSQGTFELTRTRWGSRLFARLARRQRFIALFVTNVRGPDGLLEVAGAPLVRAWPVAAIQGNVRFGVAAMSYAGRLEVAIHADAGALRVPEAGTALADELARLASPSAEPAAAEPHRVETSSWTRWLGRPRHRRVPAKPPRH